MLRATHLARYRLDYHELSPKDETSTFLKQASSLPNKYYWLYPGIIPEALRFMDKTTFSQTAVFRALPTDAKID
ncbi:unnamed protein product [Allacma fusca]|uniref:Uncharacterized protein n=1 Tax=Allacma fusca TaxID=39272 RepID=A0A8J2NIS6_9HEXA|nr:unnamed protein product [Allacma fusca]